MKLDRFSVLKKSNAGAVRVCVNNNLLIDSLFMHGLLNFRFADYFHAVTVQSISIFRRLTLEFALVPSFL